MQTSRDDFVIAVRSAFLKKGAQQRFSILGLIFFSVIFLILGNFNYKPIDYIKIAIKEIVYASSFTVSIAENFIKKTYVNISSHITHYEDYQKIKNELEKLRSKNLSRKILTLENTKYKKLVDNYFIEENETYAKVLIDKQSPFLRSIIINKGSKNNIKLGMIILDENYLVGKVIEVNYVTSRVLLISDINSKIPVSLQPGDIQAIMSGKGKKIGVLQYIKNSKVIENDKQDFLVLTSGAGEAFKEGIPIGIIKNEKSTLNSTDKIVHFKKDFEQLKYVKVVSYAKETESLDLTSKNDSKKIEDKIQEKNQEQEVLRILREQKKIAREIRIKIEEENSVLKNKIIKLQNELIMTKKTIKKNKNESEKIQFLQLNLLYGSKCKKTFFNKLHKIGSDEYKTCVLNKGKIKKN